jgi:asparagine synthase (glutamine-hydrolysing)
MKDYNIGIDWKSMALQNKNRGPDMTSYDDYDSGIITFHRLAINDLEQCGMQPFHYKFNGYTYTVVCNGEIYNHTSLEALTLIECDYKLKSKSDCEFLLPYFVHVCDENESTFFNTLLGEYSLVIIKRNDVTNDANIILGTDQMSVRPLFFQLIENKGLLISSTLMGMAETGYENVRLEQCEYRTYLQNADGIKLIKSSIYHNYVDKNLYVNVECPELYHKIVRVITNSVERRLMSDRPICCLLSGGWDSLRVAALTCRLLKKRGVTAPLHTFTIAMKNGSDLLPAREAAEFLGTVHTEVLITKDEAIAAIPEVVRVTGSFDTTTIRASTPQYLLMKYISENTEFKVCLNGDGADEVEMGYLYFYLAENDESAQKESLKLIKNISKFDGLRVDRNISAHGIEARVPLEDIEYVNLFVNIDPILKRPTKTRMEKYLSRKAFEYVFADDPILPANLIWRKKEAFSDGISDAEESWFEITKRVGCEMISDDELQRLQIEHANHMPPLTHEEAYYRKIFTSYYGKQSEKTIPYKWLPNQDWSGNVQDPSARVLQVYNS